MDEILEILPKPANQCRLAFVFTAAKPEKDTGYVLRNKTSLMEAGFQLEEIDIDGKREDELRSLLEGKDVIFVEGGNAFFLLKCVRESGFDKIVKELIERGVLYIGSSAGSYIACPTIETATWKRKDKPRFGVTDLRAMNLVPFLFFAHYAPEYDGLLKEGIAQTKFPVKILTDEQAILVKDGKARLVGKGTEVKL